MFFVFKIYIQCLMGKIGPENWKLFKKNYNVDMGRIVREFLRRQMGIRHFWKVIGKSFRLIKKRIPKWKYKKLIVKCKGESKWEHTDWTSLTRGTYWDI